MNGAKAAPDALARRPLTRTWMFDDQDGLELGQLNSDPGHSLPSTGLGWPQRLLLLSFQDGTGQKWIHK